MKSQVYYFTYPVYNTSRMQVFNATKHLVEEIGHTLMVKIHLYYLTKISIHQLHDKIPGTK